MPLDVQSNGFEGRGITSRVAPVLGRLLRQRRMVIYGARQESLLLEHTAEREEDRDGSAVIASRLMDARGCWGR